MPAIRVNRLLWAVVAALALLFAVLDPPASRGLAFPATLAFWLLHVGVGMLLAVRATEWLSRRARVASWSPWVRLLAGGLLGSALFAPFALAVDTVLPTGSFGEPPDDLLDHWEAGGGPLALLAEWLQLSPSYLASWLLVNAVPLASTPSLHAIGAPARSIDAAGVAPPPRTAAGPASTPPTDLPAPSADAAATPQPPAAQPPRGTDLTAARAAFLAQLPPAIGTELIAIQADLHYLQVRTTRGRATVLASIAAAEVALGDDGLRVHRSHWVALNHVARLSRTARGTYLTLSDGSRVPVSRRRTGEVQARLGRDFVVDPA
jgi:hypothetical protein